MHVAEKERLSKEAEMQIAALRKINHWKMIALAVSAIGVALVYGGFAGTAQNLFLGILGIVSMVIGVVCAIALNLGLKNGRRNVGKILDVLEGHYINEGVVS